MQDTELKRADTAILFSAESEWATRSETLPSMKLNHWHDVRDWYRGYLDAGARADVVPLAYDWSGYQTIVLPTVIALSDEEAEDEPAEIGLSNGLTTRLWQNDVTSVAPDTRVLATYVGTAAADWELDGVPAITSHPHGQGAAIYVGYDLGRHDIARLLKEFGSCWRELSAQPTEGGQTPTYPTTDPRILHTIRRSADGSTRFDFYLNRSNQPVAVNGIEGEPIIVYRCEADTTGYTLNRNAILIAKASC